MPHSVVETTWASESYMLDVRFGSATLQLFVRKSTSEFIPQL